MRSFYLHLDVRLQPWSIIKYKLLQFVEVFVPQIHEPLFFFYQTPT